MTDIQVLNRIANVVRGDGNLTSRSCYGAVAAYIKRNPERSNIIYVYGMDDNATHVILTDKRQKVLVDTMNANHKERTKNDPYAQYDRHQPDFKHNLYVVCLDNGLWEYPLIRHVTVNDLIQNY